MLLIRQEQAGDIEVIRAVNEHAFGQPEEADIVDKLRESGNNFLSLVAIRDEEVVGHILFSLATIDQNSGVIEGMGLAPMAVLLVFQGQRIGSALVEYGLSALRERSCPFVIVLGHPEYYPRFGFETASGHGISCQWDNIADEAFMVLILDENVMKNVSGTAQYQDAFGWAA